MEAEPKQEKHVWYLMQFTLPQNHIKSLHLIVYLKKKLLKTQLSDLQKSFLTY